MRLKTEPLLDAATIRARVAEMGERITADFAGKPLVLLTVLKGGMVFAADLMRHLDLDVELDFIGVRSYDGFHSQGRIEWTYKPDVDLQSRHVLLVEDILDTGRTSKAIIAWIEAQGAAEAALCVLLDKPSRRVVPVTPRYTGFTIENRFVVGYGLDYNARYRHLPDIYEFDDNPC